VAVDIPSGVHGDSGQVLGTAAPARATVTFHLAKPGHLLLPARELIGELVVADIGIPSAVTDTLAPTLSANHPDLWRAALPRRSGASHKYRHGHALVLGGAETTSGAGRLAAGAALRAGAGLVTVLCPASASQAYAAQLTAVMLAPFADDDGFAAQLVDPRRNAVLLGPGCGVGEPLARRVLMTLGTGKAVVLDADALTSFAGDPTRLFAHIQGPCLMTPHEGELERLFDLAGDKLTRARAAAAASGAVLLLKGADSVIAAPDGRACIQPDAPASLATAGSGDVLAGVALGLAAQGMPLFEAAAAAVWLHAQAARAAGPGLIAEDLVGQLPQALRALPPRAAVP
jgi:NAD(P)H-hydrate epimerase